MRYLLESRVLAKVHLTDDCPASPPLPGGYLVLLKSLPSTKASTRSLASFPINLLSHYCNWGLLKALPSR
jgi:hypothetical protein